MNLNNTSHRGATSGGLSLLALSTVIDGKNRFTAAVAIHSMKNLSNSDIEEIKKLHDLHKRSSWIAHKYVVRKNNLSYFLK